MIAHSAQDAIAVCRLFRYLMPDERTAVAARTMPVDLARGELVLQAQQEGRDLYVVMRGLLLASQFARSGREVGYRRLGAGDYFGEIAAIDGLPRSATIVTLDETRIARLPAALVRELLDDCPGFGRALVEDLAALVRALSGRLFEQSAVSAACRLQIEILRLAMTAGGGGSGAGGAGAGAGAVVPHMPTHAEMATLIGAQREMVTRELSRLDARGLIARRGRRLTIPDIAALAAEIERLGGDTGP